MRDGHEGFEDLFRELTPPAGGRAALLRRVRDEREGRARPGPAWRAWLVALPAAACVAAIVTALAVTSTRPQSTLPFAGDVALLRFGIGEVPAEAVTIRGEAQRRVAVRPVASLRGDVLVYEVQVLPAAKTGE